MSDVKISLYKGKGTILGLSIDNPKGFAQKIKLFKLKEITFNFSLSHLFNKTFELERLLIVSPEINYEAKSDNDNIDQIQKHIKKSLFV